MPVINTIDCQTPNWRSGVRVGHAPAPGAGQERDPACMNSYFNSGAHLDYEAGGHGGDGARLGPEAGGKRLARSRERLFHDHLRLRQL